MGEGTDTSRQSESGKDSPRRGHRMLDYLGLERNVLVMMGAISLQAVGMGMWIEYVSPVLEALGASGPMIGIVGATAPIMAAIAPYPTGLLSDRLGRGSALIMASLFALAGFCVYLVAPTWWFFIPGAILVNFALSSRFMGTMMLTGARLRENRRAVSIGVQNILKRFPNVFAPPLGGLLIVLAIRHAGKSAAPGEIQRVTEMTGLLWGFRLAVAFTILLTVLSVYLQRRHYKLPPPKKDDGSLHPWKVFLKMSGEMKRLLLSDCLMRIGTRLYMVFLPLYVIDLIKGGSDTAGGGYLGWGSLKALMALTSIVLYVPIAKLSDRAGRASRRPFVAVTYFFFALFPVVLVLAPSAVWLAPVFVVAGLREFGEPARKALIIDLASREQLGRQIGVYHMIRGMSMSGAPIVGGFLWQYNAKSPFILGGIISFAALAWFAFESAYFKRSTSS